MVTGSGWSWITFILWSLKSVLLGLQFLCTDRAGAHVRLRSDDATAVVCIIRCGSMRPKLQALPEQFFEWAASQSISLSAAHVQGVSNVTVNEESGIGRMDGEWMLQPCVFWAALSTILYS